MVPAFDAELRADVTAARRARSIVASALAGAECQADATLIVSELVTNAVIHGRPPIRLRVDRLPGTFRIEVLDGLPGPLTLRPPSLGLELVSRVARAWGVTSAQRDGKIVWAEIDCAE